ncbi:NADH:ubiquinone oxidoreductase subunit NDUFA12 [Candidatus Paracaedibacter symbiosus]|uniref:NADH:ubiquinone oxidoreductase subunit NDUFA12 n=1 Tax=Candidatus Paracaedibacter symbiosus TaxID=244582 RepID=UPI00068B6C49|nr:NADH:ubiquinone oxidoreductase subunit NDUFA12 [Candidatus Paracaedibacter symbiosus]
MAAFLKMNIITCLLTKFRGQFVGEDAYGNKYYQDKRVRDNGKHRRWVIYKGEVEASKVPPKWHAWLHYVIDTPPSTNTIAYQWEKPHRRNLTGTKFAYKPRGWAQTGVINVMPDYESWKPE